MARQTRNKDFFDRYSTVQYRHQTWVAIKIDRTLVRTHHRGSRTATKEIGTMWGIVTVYSTPAYVSKGLKVDDESGHET